MKADTGIQIERNVFLCVESENTVKIPINQINKPAIPENVAIIPKIDAGIIIKLLFLILFRK